MDIVNQHEKLIKALPPTSSRPPFSSSSTSTSLDLFNPQKPLHTCSAGELRQRLAAQENLLADKGLIARMEGGEFKITAHIAKIQDTLRAVEEAGKLETLLASMTLNLASSSTSMDTKSQASSSSLSSSSLASNGASSDAVLQQVLRHRKKERLRIQRGSAKSQTAAFNRRAQLTHKSSKTYKGESFASLPPKLMDAARADRLERQAKTMWLTSSDETNRAIQNDNDMRLYDEQEEEEEDRGMEGKMME
jgi:hypothetical protein